MKEKDFKKIMQQSKLQIEYPDFEENVMEKVLAKNATRKQVWRNLRISWVFFFIGTFFGVLVTQFLSDIQIPLFGDNSKVILLIGEFLIVIVVSSQFDSLFRFTFKKRE